MWKILHIAKLILWPAAPLLIHHTVSLLLFYFFNVLIHISYGILAHRNGFASMMLDLDSRVRGLVIFVSFHKKLCLLFLNTPANKLA
jgi:hypothetical protein